MIPRFDVVFLIYGIDDGNDDGNGEGDALTS